MEAQDGLDELFRSKLEDGHAPIPSFSWEAIREKVALEKDKRSKKVAFPFLWMAASFITGLVASGLFFYQYQLETENHYLKELALQNKKQQLSTSDLQTSQKAVLKTIDHQFIVKSTSKNKNIQSNNSASSKEANLNANLSHTSSKLTVQPSPVRQEEKQRFPLISSNPHKEEADLQKAPFTKSKFLITSSEKQVIKSFPPVSTSSFATYPTLRQEGQSGIRVTASTLKKKEIKKNRTQVSISSLLSKKQDPLISENETKASTDLPHVNVTSISVNAMSEGTASLIAVGSDESKKMSTSPITIDSLIVIALDSFPQIETKIKKPSKEKEIPKKEPCLFGLPISLGVYIAPEWASRSLKFSGNEEPELVTYKKNDQHKFGYSAGISLDLKLPERFYLRTGLNYWNVGDQNYTVIKSQPSKSSSYSPNPEKTTDFSTSTPRDTIGFGPTFTNSEMSLGNLTREFSSRTKNNYHYLGIPALLGMKLGLSKLSAGIYSGVLVNILLSPSRSVYYVYYDPNNPDQFSESYRELSRFSLTYWGGIDIDYKLSKNWTVNLCPNVKYSLTALYKDKETVRQLPYSFGIQVGCKYSF